MCIVISRVIVDSQVRSNFNGCPTSKDIVGNVPACMLTTFDDFILSKV